MAAERAEVGPVPLGLIEGSLYRDGPVPPFAPTAVVHALQHGLDDAGPPVLPSGGTASGAIQALLAGQKARLQLGCVAVQEPGALVITHVPPWVDDAIRVVDVRNESSMQAGIRIVCDLADGVDPADAWRWVESLWPVTVVVECRLPAPMRTRLHEWGAGDGSGLEALAALL